MSTSTAIAGPSKLDLNEPIMKTIIGVIIAGLLVVA